MVLISLVSVLNLLYFYISTIRSMCAVPSTAVFCSSMTACFPGMLLTYFLNDFEIVPVAPIITGITFVFTFHMRCISIVRSLYFRIFSVSILITYYYYWYHHHRNFRDFILSDVDFERRKYPSARRPLSANSIVSDTDIFHGRSVSVNDLLVSDTLNTQVRHCLNLWSCSKSNPCVLCFRFS